MQDEDIEMKAEEETELILPVRSIEQSQDWDCGPTSVRIALRYQFGLKLTANDMILLCGATESGNDEYNLMKGLNALGFKYRQTDHGTFNQLKKCIQEGQTPIIHVVMNDGGGHFMVFAGYDENNVYLADPAAGKVLKYGIPFFLGVWKVEEKETQTRWYMVITGHEADRIGSIIQKLKRIQKKVVNSRR